MFVAVSFWAGVAAAQTIPPLDQAAGDQDRPPRYGQLAQSTYPLFDNMVSELRRFDAGTQPHEAKALRRLIGDVWDHLEIFVYAYPTGRNDLVVHLLPALRRGYDRMGDFKDLFDRQLLDISPTRALDRLSPRAIHYDEAEVAAARGAVLEWRQELLRPGILETYRSYVRRPSLTHMFQRPKRLLSKCYWGAVTAVPSTDLSGAQNLRNLMVALLEKLEQQYATIADIDDLLAGQNDAAFHDFRVRVRCLLSIVRYFPSITANVRDAGAIEFQLTELVDRYGDLNDTIMAFDAVTAKEQRSRAEELRRQITQEWSELKKWQIKMRVKSQLAVYADGLRLPSGKRQPLEPDRR